jgi:hypothetical protein
MNRTKIIIGIIALFLFIGLGFVAWVFDFFPSDAFEASLRKSIQQNRGGTIAMKNLTPFEWDRLNIYPPYSSVEGMGEKFIQVDEGSCILVFLKNANVVYHLEYNRFYGDFAELYRDSGYSPEEAIFSIPSNGHKYWLKLELVK